MLPATPYFIFLKLGMSKLFTKGQTSNLTSFSEPDVVYLYPILGAKAAQNWVKICQIQSKIGGKNQRVKLVIFSKMTAARIKLYALCSMLYALC
jgi:hypothetical protein